MSATDPNIHLDPSATLHNPLLSKAELGRPRLRFFTLPPEGFTYGRKNFSRDGGAREAMHWTASTNRVEFNTTPLPKDFIAMNREALAAGFTTAHGQTDFRVLHDIRQRDKNGRARCRSDIPKSAPPNIAYGISTRPSTPINELLEHKYQERWVQERKRSLLEEFDRNEDERRALRTVNQTKTSLMRKKTPTVECYTFWQMPRFQKTPSKVASFRNFASKDKSFKVHQEEAPKRKGIFGQGIYKAY
ncbi:hypothetical protein LOD99_13673 [Oopsacas minuta]|uniref:Cilia- and flagella-associated protein 77 n=1 Tax=Oopsacas minuta TaxID=111878 RepID=A0AAV7KJ44_9METZ|nr:hypothetical protein LOD99_13673 [Oopsacas minuta]